MSDFDTLLIKRSLQCNPKPKQHILHIHQIDLEKWGWILILFLIAWEKYKEVTWQVKCPLQISSPESREIGSP